MWDGHSCPSPLTLMLILFLTLIFFVIRREAGAPSLPHSESRDNPCSKAARVGILTSAVVSYEAGPTEPK
jgi:hypothetical protein